MVPCVDTTLDLPRAVRLWDEEQPGPHPGVRDASSFSLDPQDMSSTSTVPVLGAPPGHACGTRMTGQPTLVTAQGSQVPTLGFSPHPPSG